VYSDDVEAGRKWDILQVSQLLCNLMSCVLSNLIWDIGLYFNGETIYKFTCVVSTSLCQLRSMSSDKVWYQQCSNWVLITTVLEWSCQTIIVTSVFISCGSNYISLAPFS
jgi:hypothetical protein